MREERWTIPVHSPLSTSFCGTFKSIAAPSTSEMSDAEAELKRLRIVVQEQQKVIEKKTEELTAMQRDSRAIFSNWDRKVRETEKRTEQGAVDAEARFQVALDEANSATQAARKECDKLRESFCFVFTQYHREREGERDVQAAHRSRVRKW